MRDPSKEIVDGLICYKWPGLNEKLKPFTITHELANRLEGKTKKETQKNILDYLKEETDGCQYITMAINGWPIFIGGRYKYKD